MPQLYFSVDDATAEELALRARQAGLSLSRDLATLVRRQVGEEWPDGYLDGVLGSCRDHPLEEPEELPVRGVDLWGPTSSTPTCASPS